MGDRHHFLPASFLFSFAFLRKTNPRKSLIHMGDKTTQEITNCPIDSVGCITNLYTVSGDNSDLPGDFIEKVWNKYEDRLSYAIKKLINGSITASEWLRILVPFVAGLLLRGPDFDSRFTKRIDDLNLSKYNSKDNTNYARLIELQRLIGPIAVAKWILIKVISDQPNITTDIGYAPFKNEEIGDIGMAIPLDLDHILLIVPQYERKILFLQKGIWLPIIEYFVDETNSNNKLNETMANYAQRFIYASDLGLIKKLITYKSSMEISLEPEELGFLSSLYARAHEFTWHQLVTAVEKDPSENSNSDFDIDISVLNKSWCPPLIFPMNLRKFPSALRREGDFISVHFYDPKVFYILNEIFMNEESKNFEIVVSICEQFDLEELEPQIAIKILLSKADAYYELKSYDMAINCYNEVLKIDPRNSRALNNLGNIKSFIGKYLEAIDYYSDAYEANPSIVKPLINRGVAIFKGGEIENGIIDITKAIDIAKDPSSKASAYYNRGLIYSEINEKDKAFDDFNQAILFSIDQEVKASCLLARAKILFDRQSYKSVVDDLNEAINIASLVFDSHFLRGIANEALGQFDEAFFDLSTAFTLAKTDDEKYLVYTEIGKTFSEFEHFLAGIDFFRFAREIKPEDCEAIYNIGINYLMLGKIKKSITYFSSVIENNGEHAKAFHNRGLSFGLLGHIDKAKDDLAIAADLFSLPSEKAAPLRNLALFLMVNGNEDQAQLACKESLNYQDDDSLNCSIMKGRFAFFSGNYMLSKQIHIKVKKTFKICNPFLALPILLLGDDAEALSIIKQFLATNPVEIELIQLLQDFNWVQEKFLDLKNVKKIIQMLFLGLHGTDF